MFQAISRLLPSLLVVHGSVDVDVDVDVAVAVAVAVAIAVVNVRPHQRLAGVPSSQSDPFYLICT